MSLYNNCNLVDLWITEYARDCMFSCFQNFELEGSNEICSLIHGKTLKVVLITASDRIRVSRWPHRTLCMS